MVLSAAAAAAVDVVASVSNYSELHFLAERKHHRKRALKDLLCVIVRYASSFLVLLLDIFCVNSRKMAISTPSFNESVKTIILNQIFHFQPRPPPSFGSGRPTGGPPALMFFRAPMAGAKRMARMRRRFWIDKRNNKV